MLLGFLEHRDLFCSYTLYYQYSIVSFGSLYDKRGTLLFHDIYMELG